MAYYLIYKGEIVSAAYSEKPAILPFGFSVAEGDDLTREEAFFDGQQVVAKPPKPEEGFFWDASSLKWVKPSLMVSDAVTSSPLNRSGFLMAIIQTTAFRWISDRSSELGGAIATELGSLKSLINVSREMMHDKEYEPLLKRSLGRAKTLLEEANTPWTAEQIHEINELLKTVLKVTWTL